MTAISKLSNVALLAELRRAARAERLATAHLIALLMEVESRGLHLAQGFSSLFMYCTQALHLSEHAAYNRIETARAARRYPIILELVKAGDVTLTAVRLLAPHLTTSNHVELLSRVRHKSKREIELLVATLHPQPDVASSIRKLPASAPQPSVINEACAPPAVGVLAQETGGGQTASGGGRMPRCEVKPLSAERYKIQFTVDSETHAQLRRVQDLLRHAISDGDVAAIFCRALNSLEASLKRRKLGAVDRPRSARSPKPDSRHVPAAIRRAVWRRDGGRCAYQGGQGRCDATAFLEYHHVVPFAVGGEMSASNLELRCRAHNQYEAEQYFGRAGPPTAPPNGRPSATTPDSFRNELGAPG